MYHPADGFVQAFPGFRGSSPCRTSLVFDGAPAPLTLMAGTTNATTFRGPIRVSKTRGCRVSSAGEEPVCKTEGGGSNLSNGTTLFDSSVSPDASDRSPR